MTADLFIQYRVTPAIKALIRALAHRDRIIQSAYIKQLLDVLLHWSVAADCTCDSSAVAKTTDMPNGPKREPEIGMVLPAHPATYNQENEPSESQ